MIRVEGLTKNYAAFPALKGISFQVGRGEVVGFLGPNGAGKTTTLRILTGFMPATRGTVTVAGHDVIRDSRAVRQAVGYLPEDVPLYRDLTVSAFLAYMSGLKEVSRSRVRSEVERVMGLTGLTAMRGRLISKLSRGYRQRTGLAQALLGDPPVLLMDEPTSGLDPNQVAEVRDLIRRLSGEKTVLLSSHILSEVSQICGRVLIVDAGRLVASGEPAELARRFGAGQTLALRVRGTLDPGVLAGVPEVRRVEPDPREPGAFTLTVGDPEGAAAAVARRVVDAGADLLELRRESVDLEAIFRAVTAERPDA